MRAAVIGIGSNSLRMLLSEVNSDGFERIRRYREGLRMFSALDEKGFFSDEMMELAADKVCDFCVQAREDGADEIHVFATSAVRDAANREEFSQRIACRTGLKLDICGGEKEAALSFWGASKPGPCALIDIGGGSTEIAYGCGREIYSSISLQMGAVRLAREKEIKSAEDAFALAEKLVDTMKSRTKAIPREINWVGVGGTFTTVSALAQKITWDMKGRIHGFELTRQQIIEAIEELAPMNPQRRAELPYLQPQRADIIVHGLSILLACFLTYGFEKIEVSEYGNLEGYLKDCYHLV